MTVVNIANSNPSTNHPKPQPGYIVEVALYSNQSLPRLPPVCVHVNADGAAGDCTKPETASGPLQAVRPSRLPSVAFFLQGAKEALDTPIHPGGARFCGLVLDIERP
jgi:hypothetical protein